MAGSKEIKRPGEGEDIMSLFWGLADGTEVPDQFALWSGILAVSAIMGRKCWIDRSIYEIRPNLYVLFVAPPGRNKKSTAIGWAKRALKRVNPKPEILATRITPEAIKQTLSSDGGVKEAHGIILADEFTVFLDQASWKWGLGNLLTELYDCNDTSHHTSGGGRIDLMSPYIVMLGGTTPKTIRDGFPKEFIGSGLASRFICVYIDDKKPPVPFPEGGKAILFDKIVKELERIRMIKGEFVLSPEARSFYDLKYREWFNNPLYDELSAMIDGYPSRRCDIMLKLSMIMCAITTHDKLISDKHLATSEKMLVDNESFLPTAHRLITGTDVGGFNKEILEFIRRYGMIARKAVVREFKNKMDLRQIDEGLRLLLSSDEVETKFEAGTQFFKYKVQAERKGSK